MERRNKNEKGANTQGILKELDDLQGLLDKNTQADEPGTETPPVSASTVGPFDDIPLLIPESDHDSPVRVKASTPNAHSALRTREEAVTPSGAGAKTDSSLRENPFLTYQTREKLAYNQQQLEQDITNSSQSVAAQPLVNSPPPSPPGVINRKTGLADKDIDSLVDQIVAEWLPRIEKDLKKKLRTILSQH